MRCRTSLRVLMCCTLVVLASAAASAAVKLPALIGDNMVLQRGQPVHIWGWADKGEEVTVTVAGQTLTAKAGDDGRWKVTLDKLTVGRPLEMTVKGSSGNAITVKNIAVGEVWVCSGQSNMEMGIRQIDNAENEIAAANYPSIRLMLQPKTFGVVPMTIPSGQWKVCSPETIIQNGWEGFSAAGYFFGRRLHDELKIPIGLISTSWGGSPVEAWIEAGVLAKHPDFSDAVERLHMLNSIEGIDNFAASPDTEAQIVWTPGALYNGMIAPFVKFGICGTIWYQGESNAARGFQYRSLLTMMIEDWRKKWDQGNFPFYIAQLANWANELPPAQTPEDSDWAELRESQAYVAKTVPESGLAVMIDIGDSIDIHPKNKQDAGIRLALIALAKYYKKDIPFSGPEYKTHTVEGSSVRLSFNHADGGLTAKNGALKGFAIAGLDKKFYWANAVIERDTIVVSSPNVAEPAAVRYAWAMDPVCNLYNGAGLPAVPFRTDGWNRY